MEFSNEQKAAPAPVLRDNWYEERLVDPIDRDDPYWMRHGHKCLLTIKPVDTDIYLSTAHRDFIPFIQPIVDKIPSKRDLLERFVYDKHVKNFNTPVVHKKPEMVFKTETKERYKVEGFIPEEVDLKETRKFLTELPTTYWTEKRVKRHPVTQVMKKNDFRRTSFMAPRF